MDWARILAFVTGTVDQELLARIEYLAAENRILKAQLKGRMKLSDAERARLGEIGHRLGRKVLGEVATVARPDTIFDVAGRCRPFDRRPCTPDWPTPPQSGHSPSHGFSLAMRMINCSTARLIRGRPRRRRAFEPLNLRATSLRYQATRRAYSMPRATGRPVALLLSGGSVTACSANERTD